MALHLRRLRSVWGIRRTFHKRQRKSAKHSTLNWLTATNG